MNDDAKDSASGFWLFSLALYGREGVQKSCLQLQDEFEADVNLLLWCCWLAWDRGYIVSDTDLEDADGRVTVWRETVLKPLRQARRAAKGSDDCYQALKQAELDAECHAQGLIHDGLGIENSDTAAMGLRLSQTHQALRNYLVGWLGVEEGEASPHIAQLLNGLKTL